MDPHGHYLDDARVKLVGLAEYAEEYGAEYLRIDALTDLNGEMRVLDMQDEDTRGEVKRSVRTGVSALELYQKVGRMYA